MQVIILISIILFASTVSGCTVIAVAGTVVSTTASVVGSAVETTVDVVGAGVKKAAGAGDDDK